jgi:leucyl-tRNA synthetase
LQLIDKSYDLNWPNFDENLLKEDKVKIVIQINGKKRELFEVNRDTTEEELLEIIKKDHKLIKFINGSIKRNIFIPNKLINIIL